MLVGVYSNLIVTTGAAALCSVDCIRISDVGWGGGWGGKTIQEIVSCCACVCAVCMPSWIRGKKRVVRLPFSLFAPPGLPFAFFVPPAFPLSTSVNK